MLIYGIHAVREALLADCVTRVRVLARGGPRVQEIARLAADRGVAVRWVDAEDLDRVAAGGVHQGVGAELRAAAEHAVADLIRNARGVPLLVVLDGIEDPHNVGAILRTADAAGADGVIRQTRHAAPLGAAVAKASAGAVAHLRVASVVNIAHALADLKAAGVWTVGLAGEAATRYDQVDLTLPTALVFGAEDRGLRRLVRDRCDWVVSIPMAGHVESLNVSVAAGIALFEARRQRDRAAASKVPASEGLRDGT